MNQEFDDEVPDKLEPYWEGEWYYWHTPAWWSRLWRRTGLVDIEVADSLPNGWKVWMTWETTAKASGLWGRMGDIDLLQADGGEYLGLTRVVARRKTCE